MARPKKNIEPKTQEEEPRIVEKIIEKEVEVVKPLLSEEEIEDFEKMDSLLKEVYLSTNNVPIRLDIQRWRGKIKEICEKCRKS